MTYVAKTPTYTKGGRYVERGQLVEDSEVDYVAGVSDSHLADIKEGVELAVVEIAAIAPSGPNPQNPQQLPPDGYQTPAGYGQPGARLIGEQNKPPEEALVDPIAESETQGQIVEAIEKSDADQAEKARDDADRQAKAAKEEAEAQAKADAKAAKGGNGKKVEVIEG